MFLKKWGNLPDYIRNEKVRGYYDILCRKKIQIVVKRLFDFFLALIMLVVLAIPMIVLAIIIKVDSCGPVFYRQERVTTYGRRFRVHKFRTMIVDADKMGTMITVRNDSRITRVGAWLRRFRLDELPQLFDVLCGDMSFVGTRPEAVKYVEKYKPVFYATLLMPAGITSEASIRFKDENELLSGEEDADKVYIDKILPEKMRWNLESIKQFSLFRDLMTMFKTVFAVLGKDNKKE